MEEKGGSEAVKNRDEETSSHLCNPHNRGTSVRMRRQSCADNQQAVQRLKPVKMCASWPADTRRRENEEEVMLWLHLSTVTVLQRRRDTATADTMEI